MSRGPDVFISSSIESSRVHLMTRSLTDLWPLPESMLAQLCYAYMCYQDNRLMMPQPYVKHDMMHWYKYIHSSVLLSVILLETCLFETMTSYSYIQLTSTGIDADASKGETSPGYLTASWFIAMNAGQFWPIHLTNVCNERDTWTPTWCRTASLSQLSHTHLLFMYYQHQSIETSKNSPPD